MADDTPTDIDPEDAMIVQRSELQLDLGDACVNAMRKINNDGRRCTIGDMIAGLEFARIRLQDALREPQFRLVENRLN